MKDWQHGYDLEYLKGLESKYEHYNTFTLSPFTQMKKNNIAEGLWDKSLNVLDDNTMIQVNEVKMPSDITMHLDTVIGKKHKGDLVFTKLTGDETLLMHFMNKKIKNIFGITDSWIYVWAEDPKMNEFAKFMLYSLVGPKITTFGEIFNIYYKGSKRSFPYVDPAEYVSIKRIVDKSTCYLDTIREKLKTLPEFTNHYSNYNKGKSWSALSLRGYSFDPSFITKPSEMNEKWQKENEHLVFLMQDTPLYDTFPEVRKIVDYFGKDVHRVRFMKLAPGGGELKRHTDQVDRDSGGSLGKLARIHIPIVTNPDVIFTVWSTKGIPEKVNMKVGEAWFLDTRKPHQAINGGTEDRIHLVIDIVTDSVLHSSIIK